MALVLRGGGFEETLMALPCGACPAQAVNKTVNIKVNIVFDFMMAGQVYG